MLGPLRAYVTEGRPPPAPELHKERLIYGFAQPVVGVRRLFSDRALLRRALTPVVFLAAFCAFTALVQHEAGAGLRAFFHDFYATFSMLAPLPSILFGAHYARLAAQAHVSFGRACSPKIDSFPRAVKRALYQSLLVGSASIPLAVVAGVGDVGPVLAAIASALWGLHWIVVGAFDGAQVLAPGQSLADADRAALAVPAPWFVRGLEVAANKSSRRIGGLFRLAARIEERLSRGWREEIRLIEEERVVALGFAAATAILLATPILNLFFRPVIIVAATHLLVQVRRDPREALAPATVPGGTSSPDTSP